MLIFSATTFAQENKPPYRKLTPTTYEVPIVDIRAANIIFIEHQNYVKIFAEMKIQADAMSKTIILLEKNNCDLEKNNEDYKAMLVVKDQQILDNNTYHTIKIKSVKRQRNGAYVIAIAATVVSVLVLTK